MSKKTDLIGYCGMYCGDCVGQTQTVANLAKDLRVELRRYRFQESAKDFAKIPMFKEFKDYEKCYNLLGTMMKLRCKKTCRGGGGPPDCKIRKCCREKGIKGCWLTGCAISPAAWGRQSARWRPRRSLAGLLPA